MSDERVWLRHAEHGGSFHCPAGAVEEWQAMGWEPAEPPEEHNPVVAEMLAAQSAAAELVSQAKPSRRGGTDTTPQES